jgi:putative transposase
MREMGLLAKRPRKRKRTTHSEHELPRYPNRIMGIAIKRPKQVWVGDITYIQLHQKFVYLAVLMDVDVYTRSIVDLLRQHEFEISMVEERIHSSLDI